MSYSWTLALMREKIQNELNLQGEDFVSNAELDEYLNFGIDLCEAIIHAMNEDYFLTSTTISLVSGTQDYALPSDIFAHKIRFIQYSDGNNNYAVRKIQELKDVVQFDSQYTGEYWYILRNDSTSGPMIRILPASRETSTNMTLWYIRNAKRLSLDSDVCDIPEFAHYVMEIAKIRVKEKEMLDSSQASSALKEIEQKMIDVLTPRVDDEDNKIRPDESFDEYTGEHFSEFF